MVAKRIKNKTVTNEIQFTCNLVSDYAKLKCFGYCQAFVIGTNLTASLARSKMWFGWFTTLSNPWMSLLSAKPAWVESIRQNGSHEIVDDKRCNIQTEVLQAEADDTYHCPTSCTSMFIGSKASNRLIRFKTIYLIEILQAQKNLFKVMTRAASMFCIKKQISHLLPSEQRRPVKSISEGLKLLQLRDFHCSTNHCSMIIQ